jgi:DNA-binding transcriptional LysR family regulator
MEMTQLEFFLKVVEEGSFSKAADIVCRTQPAVSIAIRRLEEEVGAPLFDRSQKIPKLTEAGQVVHDYAQRIIALRNQARDSVAELLSLQRGRVRIGANESSSLYLLPQILLRFREKHPEVKVEISRLQSDRLPREVIDRNLDFGVLAFEPTDRELQSFCVLKDELALILHPSHRLARRDSVSIEDLGNESFLAHNVKTASRTKVVEAFAEHRTPLNIMLELATIETIKRFVQMNIGLAIVPHMCVREEIERETLASVPVQGLNYKRKLWVTYRRNAIFSQAAEAFFRILKQYAIDSRPKPAEHTPPKRSNKSADRKNSRQSAT